MKSYRSYATHSFILKSKWQCELVLWADIYLFILLNIDGSQEKYQKQGNKINLYDKTKLGHEKDQVLSTCVSSD